MKEKSEILLPSLFLLSVGHGWENGWVFIVLSLVNSIVAPSFTLFFVLFYIITTFWIIINPSLFVYFILRLHISTFISYYFEPHLRTRINRVPRHDDGGEVPSSGNLSIFSNPGRPTPKNTVRERYLSEIEFRQAHNYIINFVKSVLFMFCDTINSYNPD